jgi:hypothetical protein
MPPEFFSDNHPSDPHAPEVLGQPVAPKLSDEAVTSYNRLLNDTSFARDFPAEHAALRRSVDEALAATGYQPPPGDPRSPADQLADQQLLGIDQPRSPSDYQVERPRDADQQAVEDAKQVAARLQLDPTLGAVVARDLLGPASDPEVTRRTMERTGRSYDQAVLAVQQMFDARQITKKASELSAPVLAHLALWSEALEHREGVRKLASRPS